MATPGDLVKCVSHVTGVAAPTVSQLDRRLFVAGLRTKGGRGPSAAKVTPRDAAHLLLSVIAADRVMDTERAVKRYAETIVHDDASTGSVRDIGVPEITALAHEHTFIDLIEALIAAAAAGTLHAALGRYYDDPRGILARQKLPGPEFELSAETPNTVGRLRVFGDRRCELVYGLAVVRKVTSTNINEVVARVEEIEGRAEGDLRQMRWITSKAVYGIAELFSGEPEAGNGE